MENWSKFTKSWHVFSGQSGFRDRGCQHGGCSLNPDHAVYKLRQYGYSDYGLHSVFDSVKSHVDILKHCEQFFQRPKIYSVYYLVKGGPVDVLINPP